MCVKICNKLHSAACVVLSGTALISWFPWGVRLGWYAFGFCLAGSPPARTVLCCLSACNTSLGVRHYPQPVLFLAGPTQLFASSLSRRGTFTVLFLLVLSLLMRQFVLEIQIFVIFLSYLIFELLQIIHLVTSVPLCLNDMIVIFYE